jgi:CBS domain containing-hemolysin-like protein
VVAGLVLGVILIVANGFFVATEFALARLRPTQVQGFLEEERAGAKSVQHAIERLDAYLAACQLGITMASIGLGVVGEAALSELLEPLVGEIHILGRVALTGLIAFAIITLLQVVIGELSPKSLAIARTDRTALWVAPPMRIFYLVTRPFVDSLNFLGNLLLKPFGVPPAREAVPAPHSEAELIGLLKESGATGMIEPEESELAERIFALADRRAREILIPRGDVGFVTSEDDLAEVIDQALQTGFSRLPLCEPEGGLDEAIGVVHVKDLLRPAVSDGQIPLRELARPLFRVSESMRIDELLRDLRRERRHIALVVDEHGTTIGLVTLEDIIEEIVGEIEDEFDPRVIEKLIRPDGDGWVVDASASLHLLEDELGLEFPESHEATIGGYVLELLGRLPAVGEVVTLPGLRAEVTRIDEARLTELRLDTTSEDGEAEA